jgi:hypothetical protein
VIVVRRPMRSPLSEPTASEGMATRSSLQLLAGEAKDGAQTDRACAWRHVGGAAVVGDLARIAADCYVKNVDLSHLVSHMEDFVKSLQAQAVPLARSSSC